MKHWTELTELESAIFRVGEFKNLFKLLVSGTESYLDMKVLQSAIYTMESMIDDIDSTLYEKFETVFDAVRNEDTESESEEESEEEEFNHPTMNVNSVPSGYGGAVAGYGTYTVPQNEWRGSFVQACQPDGQVNNTPEEDEAFKDLEKAIKNWKPTMP
jgi:hypothetical protein